MKVWILLVVVAWVWGAEANTPFVPVNTVIGGQVWRATYDYFCLNYTSQTFTFIGGTPDLYNASGLAWNQIISVGTANPLLSLNSATFQCSTLTSVPALPTKIPLPRLAFVNGINAANNFVFPAQTGTQDTYQLLTSASIAPAVQIIQDSTTNNLDTMRFFFKTNFATLGQNCGRLGSTYQVADDPNPVQYVATVPMVAMARSSAGTIVLDKRMFTVVQTAGNDITLSLTGGPNYKLVTFLEAEYVDSTMCASGKIRLVFQFDMQYTSLNASYLVQGPHTSPGITIQPNCYNLTTRSIVPTLPCVGLTCSSQVYIQTGCRTALTNGKTFATCTSGQDPSEQHEVYFNAFASYCNLTNPTCRTTGSGSRQLPFADKVRASIAIATDSQFLEVMQFYPLATTALNNAYFANVTLVAAQTFYVAVYYPYLETQQNFDLTISNLTTFSVTVFDGTGKQLAILGYAALKSTGALAVGVKNTRKDTGGLVACDALAGCDSFAINDASILTTYPTVAYLTFNVTTIQPGGYSGFGTVGGTLTQQVLGSINITASVVDDDSSERSNLLIAGWILLSVGGAALVVGGLAIVGLGSGRAVVAGKYSKKESVCLVSHA